jgi:hypothetical protein
MGFSASCVRRLRLRDFEWRLLGFGMTVSKSKKLIFQFNISS